MIEIFHAYTEDRVKLKIETILIVEFNSLPVMIKNTNDFAFSCIDSNVFYACGVKNPSFSGEEPLFMNSEETRGVEEGLQVEKFFIENDNFSSKTLAYIKF